MDVNIWLGILAGLTVLAVGVGVVTLVFIRALQTDAERREQSQKETIENLTHRIGQLENDVKYPREHTHAVKADFEIVLTRMAVILANYQVHMTRADNQAERLRNEIDAMRSFSELMQGVVKTISSMRSRPPGETALLEKTKNL